MDQQDAIKEAFNKAKLDIQSLKDHISSVIQEIHEIRQTIEYINTIEQVKQIYQTPNSTHIQTHPHTNQTETPQTQQEDPNPTQDYPYKPLKPHIYSISTGNGGVPTDRQTDQQTDTFTHKLSNLNKIDQIEQVSHILESLDTIKKDLRSKFKHLTKQEMLVFSTLYQLEEENFAVDYPLIAKKLSLTESSIRDYVQKIIKKGIPIQKTKENNKKIILNIPHEFKQIASLQTIMQLREL